MLCCACRRSKGHNSAENIVTRSLKKIVRNFENTDKRVFNVAGRMVNPVRCRLTDKRFEVLMLSTVTNILNIDYFCLSNILRICCSGITDWGRAGEDPEGVIGAIAAPKICESNFIRHDFVQFGKKISKPMPNQYQFRISLSLCSNCLNVRDSRQFCRSLFCHSGVVSYTSSLLQLQSRYEINCEILLKPTPLTLLAGFTPGAKGRIAPLES